MPIRLNLLAEAQAAEEMRRRDPVKRALWLAGLIIAVMLAWSGFLKFRTALAKSEVARIETQLATRTNEFRLILDNQKKSAEITFKLQLLRQLAANRFLNGSLLNALQQTTVEDVQLTRLKVDQLYTTIEGTKTRTNEHNVVVKGKPPMTMEKIVLNLEGMDSSASAGDQVNRLKSVLTSNTYFRDTLARTNPVSLKSLSSPQSTPTSGKSYVTFNLECRYPEKTR